MFLLLSVHQSNASSFSIWISHKINVMTHVRFPFFNHRPIAIAVQLSAMTMTYIIVDL